MPSAAGAAASASATSSAGASRGRALGALDEVSLARLGRLGLAGDVEPPTGQPRGQTHVLPVASDRERKLIIGNDDERDAVVLEQLDADHFRRRERVHDEGRRNRRRSE